MSKVVIGKCLLIHLLIKRHMTQSDLADKTGIAKTQINEYIANTRKMSLQNAKIIANVLACHIDDLYEWKINNKK